MELVDKLEKLPSHELCIYNLFDRYSIYLRRIVISKEDLLLLLQEAPYSGLVFSSVLCFLKQTLADISFFTRYRVNL